jgi:membrane-associated phospholipid phosphatase
MGKGQSYPVSLSWAARWAATYATGYLVLLALVFGAKHGWARVRPPGPYLGNVSGGSFPSGHVAVSTYLLFVVHRVVKSVQSRFLRTVSVTLLIGFGMLVAFERIYSGAHWFSDVIVSWMIASMVFGLTVRLGRLRWIPGVGLSRRYR